jgi:hypothetical protein
MASVWLVNGCGRRAGSCLLFQRNRGLRYRYIGIRGAPEVDGRGKAYGNIAYCEK